MSIETDPRMCGTLRMGVDPAGSVVDPTGEAHDLDNSWTAESSAIVSLAAINPAFTIAANSLRIQATSGLA